MDQSALMMLRMTALLLLALVSGTTITIINSKADLAVGDDHLLLCKAGADGDITWQKDKEELPEKYTVTEVDEVSSKLFIRKATLQDAGVYTCHCVFDNAHPDETTAVQIYVHEGPSFGATQVYHEFLKGEVGLVPCLASGQPAVDVRWWRGQEEISTRVGERVRHMENNALRITDIREEDDGTYRCQAIISGRHINKELPISVVVNALPTVHIKEMINKVMAGPETNVSLLCLVTGRPTPNISWTMPVVEDPTRHHFNSDRSELTVWSVSMADYGEYVCTARNKIGESNDTILLHVSEAPEVSVSAEESTVTLGHNVSLSCNVSGHPYPQLYWIKKLCGKIVDSTSGRVRVEDGVLTIEAVAPSDGGLYSCMAVSTSGNASRDVALYTQPGPSQDMSVSPEATSLIFSLKTQPISGGTPIKSFVLQWMRGSAEKWKEVVVPLSAPLAITSLSPFTFYTVRLAAMNAVGLGMFSATLDVRTQGVRGEPDRPVLSEDKVEVEGNLLSIPVVQLDTGSSPLLHYKIRYRQEKEGAEWKEKNLPVAAAVRLPDLSFGADYRVEVTAVNANGSSIPASLKVTVPPQPVATISKGGVVAIVIVIFLAVLIAVDATCCYTHRCGLLMFIATKVFGRNVPGLKTMEEGHGTNGDLNLKGLDTPRGSIQQQQSGVQRQSKEGRLNSEVTCDKAPLTKNEKHSVNGDMPTTDA